MKGYKKKAFKEKSNTSKREIDKIIKIHTETLMTRGMKGCYVYFTDKETENILNKGLAILIILNKKNLTKKRNSKFKIPIFKYRRYDSYTIVGSAPCGLPLMHEDNTEEMIMVDKNKIRPGFTYFIVQAIGDSMNKAGDNGWGFCCLSLWG